MIHIFSLFQLLYQLVAIHVLEILLLDYLIEEYNLIPMTISKNHWRSTSKAESQMGEEKLNVIWKRQIYEKMDDAD